MDYEKLIERLDCPYKTSECVHFSKYGNNCEKCQEQAMVEAVYAIENLLKEREAMLKDLKRLSCGACKHRKDDFTCSQCTNSSEWEWNHNPEK